MKINSDLGSAEGEWTIVKFIGGTCHILGGFLGASLKSYSEKDLKIKISQRKIAFVYRPILFVEIFC